MRSGFMAIARSSFDHSLPSFGLTTNVYLQKIKDVEKTNFIMVLWPTESYIQIVTECPLVRDPDEWKRPTKHKVWLLWTRFVCVSFPLYVA